MALPEAAIPSGGAISPAMAGPQAATAAGNSEAQFILRNISVIYHDAGGEKFTALRNINLDIAGGEFIAVIGLSGAGKSTLLRALNRTNEPSSGTILFEGKDVTHVQGKELMELRRQIGFIFQQFNLVRNISVLKNVLAGRLSYISWLDSMLGRFPKKDQEIALRYLKEVGLGDKVQSRADRLSGGQQQRVAIARALAQRPKVILADEPMASLDPKLSGVILGLLRRFNQEENITIIVNLHVLELAKTYADRIIALQQGEIVFDGPPDNLTPEIIESIYRTDAEMMEGL